MGLIAPGLQAKEETSTDATKFKGKVWELPFKLAETVAIWFDVIAPTLAMKLAELVPAATVTDPGIVSRESSSDSAMTVAEDAGALKFTVQLVEALDAKVPGLQLKDVKLSWVPVVIVPPAPVVSIAAPSASVPNALVTLIVVSDAAADVFTVRTATTPFWITFALRPVELNPVRKHS